MTQGQYKDRAPKIVKRLSRDEAVAYLLDVLSGNEVPFAPEEYTGGATQIVSDAICVGYASVKNYACRGRKTLPEHQRKLLQSTK